jgi:hypothetical protein
MWHRSLLAARLGGRALCTRGLCKVGEMWHRSLLAARLGGRALCTRGLCKVDEMGAPLAACGPARRASFMHQGRVPERATAFLRPSVPSCPYGFRTLGTQKSWMAPPVSRSLHATGTVSWAELKAWAAKIEPGRTNEPTMSARTVERFMRCPTHDDRDWFPTPHHQPIRRAAPGGRLASRQHPLAPTQSPTL